ncbi:MAG: filamentous hemagglutinin N-terminal domain-containing protein [Gammaproteobacteria bacterium]|nr:filamentous hemagglutinin N-terminal domain-containing protein [Gammaproteobacteria bacterium]
MKRKIEKYSYSSVLLSVLLATSGYVYAEVEFDGTLGERALLLGPDYAITESYGQRQGNNLFHSFRSFNVGEGEHARFSGTAGIDHIFARVTGGNSSYLDGLVSSDIDGVNLWIINPSGVIFGKNFRLDIHGAFISSTATDIEFGDGSLFSSSTESTTTSRLNPNRIRLDAANSAPILVSGTVIEDAPGLSLYLVSNDVIVNNARVDIGKYFAGNRGRIDSVELTSSNNEPLNGRVDIINTDITADKSVDIGAGLVSFQHNTVTLNEGAKMRIEGERIYVSLSDINSENPQDVQLMASQEVNIVESDDFFIGQGAVGTVTDSVGFETTVSGNAGSEANWSIVSSTGSVENLLNGKIEKTVNARDAADVCSSEALQVQGRVRWRSAPGNYKPYSDSYIQMGRECY